MSTTASEPLLSELCDLVAEIAELPPGELDPDTPFPEADIDSLLALEIAVHVERRYDVRFEEADLKRMATVRDLGDLVESRRG